MSPGSYDSGTTTEPNTPDSQPSLEEPHGDFARLTPVSTQAKVAFHELFISLDDEVEKYRWHRGFIYAKPDPEPLEDDHDTSASSASERNSPERAIEEPLGRKLSPFVHHGFWRFNLTLPPSEPKLGWMVGKGRWGAVTRDSHAEVDILLTGNTAQKEIRGRHIRFLHNLDSGRLLIYAAAKVKVNGFQLNRGDSRILHSGKTNIAFGQFEYEFTWTDLDQEIYRNQLRDLAQSLAHTGYTPPIFITPTPMDSEWILKDRYQVTGSFATGSSCVMYSAMDMAGVLYAVKKVTSNRPPSDDRNQVRGEVNALQKLHQQDKAPTSIYRFVELITIDPSRSLGVYDCYIVTRPLIETTMGAVLGTELRDEDRITLCVQTLDALKFLHSNGCMHRDIKLENILASRKPLQAVVIDFGCATWETQSLDHGVGTIRYLAPEVLDIKYAFSKVPYTRSVDVWSLGLTMYQFMCRWRFRGEFMTLREHVLILEQNHWRPPVRSASTQSMFDLISLMMAWNVDDRISVDTAMQTAADSGLLQFNAPHSPVPGSKRRGDEIHRETA